MEISNQKLSIQDFTLLNVLGKGSYAKVVLVKKKNSGLLYAMKIIKKSLIEKRKKEENAIMERNIYLESDHPFVIKFCGSFQNERKIFYILEYCPGGELFNLLCSRKRFSEEQYNCNNERAKFYSAQIYMAMEYLHSKDILYRDLKPENVLIDSEGYIRITDFGLAKTGVTENNAKTICGTPEYFPPEILMKKPYGKPMDWWTFGAVIFEMVSGLPPFYSKDKKTSFEKIVYSKLEFPNYFSKELQSLLNGLFIKDPAKRLGANHIKSHPWFANVKWQELLRKEFRAPFVPIIENDNGLSNFANVLPF